MGKTLYKALFCPNSLHCSANCVYFTKTATFFQNYVKFSAILIQRPYTAVATAFVQICRTDLLPIMIAIICWLWFYTVKWANTFAQTMFAGVLPVSCNGRIYGLATGDSLDEGNGLYFGWFGFSGRAGFERICSSTDRLGNLAPGSRFGHDGTNRMV